MWLNIALSISFTFFDSLPDFCWWWKKVKKRRMEREKWFMVCNSYPCISSITVSVVLEEALSWRSMTRYLMRGQIPLDDNEFFWLSFCLSSLSFPSFITGIFVSVSWWWSKLDPREWNPFLLFVWFDRSPIRRLFIPIPLTFAQINVK